MSEAQAKRQEKPKNDVEIAVAELSLLKGHCNSAIKILGAVSERLESMPVTDENELIMLQLIGHIQAAILTIKTD